MAREIKFRAWDSYHKELFQVHCLGSIFSTSDILKFGDNTTLMQYTGFKDKKGKEIYEGDILSKKWIVEWEEERGFWVIFNPALHYCALGEALYNVPELEVIGNIYENIELWEKDKDE
jgi:hypothetical protein